MNRYENPAGQNRRIPPPVPVLQPYAQAPIPEAEPQPSRKKQQIPQELLHLAEQFRHPDSETLLLLALLWLLYKEKADKKLLLALAYILL